MLNGIELIIYLFLHLKKIVCRSKSHCSKINILYFSCFPPVVWRHNNSVEMRVWLSASLSAKWPVLSESHLSRLAATLNETSDQEDG